MKFMVIGAENCNVWSEISEENTNVRIFGNRVLYFRTENIVPTQFDKNAR